MQIITLHGIDCRMDCVRHRLREETIKTAINYDAIVINSTAEKKVT